MMPIVLVAISAGAFAYYMYCVVIELRRIVAALENLRETLKDAFSATTWTP